MSQPTGTKIVVFEGGPPQWAGTVTYIAKTGGGRAERLCEVSHAHVVYAQTERTKEVEIERERRSGTVVELKTAEVYEFIGYKEDV